jgi:hypothetical protein
LYEKIITTITFKSNSTSTPENENNPKDTYEKVCYNNNSQKRENFIQLKIKYHNDDAQNIQHSKI